jgi:hypothetical protein
MNKTSLKSRLNGAITTRDPVRAGWSKTSEMSYKDPKTGIIFDIIQEGTTDAQAEAYRQFNKENNVKVNGN